MLYVQCIIGSMKNKTIGYFTNFLFFILFTNFLLIIILQWKLRGVFTYIC